MKFPVRKDVGWGSCERLLDRYVSAEGTMFYYYVQPFFPFGISEVWGQCLEKRTWPSLDVCFRYSPPDKVQCHLKTYKRRTTYFTLMTFEMKTKLSTQRSRSNVNFGVCNFVDRRIFSYLMALYQLQLLFRYRCVIGYEMNLKRWREEAVVAHFKLLCRLSLEDLKKTINLRIISVPAEIRTERLPKCYMLLGVYNFSVLFKDLEGCVLVCVSHLFPWSNIRRYARLGLETFTTCGEKNSSRVWWDWRSRNLYQSKTIIRNGQLRSMIINLHHTDWSIWRKVCATSS
jgi:hypothetical protein